MANLNSHDIVEMIKQVLRDACRAPSGDNAQPWKFQIRENVIRIINVAEKDTSLFNWRQRTNHVALGACIENLKISAESRGYRADIKLFPDSTNRLIVAEVTFTQDPAAHNELAPFIHKRASNRKKYWSKKIEQEKLDALAKLGGAEGRVAFVSDEAGVKNLARIVSAGEKLALENRPIHDFLFSHVTWSREEDAKKHGFFIDTFEFAPPQKAAFKLFSNWNILKLFLPLGISNMVAKDMEKVHATSAAFGAIIIPNNSDEAFLRAGMLLERLWLTATSLGLSMQGVTTIGYLGARVFAGDPGELSLTHQDLLRARYTDLSKAFGRAPSEPFGFTFRIGYANPPSAMTTRFEPVFEEVV
jgi:nitroreductase